MASEQAVQAAMAVWGIGDWSDALDAAFPIMLREKVEAMTDLAATALVYSTTVRRDMTGELAKRIILRALGVEP